MLSQNTSRPPRPGGGIGARRRPREGARAPDRRQRLRRTGQAGDGVRAPKNVHTHATRMRGLAHHEAAKPRSATVAEEDKIVAEDIPQGCFE